MKRVLVVTLPERGHYHPLLGPAEELTRRGAEVAFACTCDISAELAEAGVQRVITPPGASPPSAGLRGAALARVLSDAAALRRWIRELLIEVPAQNVEPLRAIVRDFRPDVVAIDTMAYDAAIAAELEGVPWVGWATSLNPVLPQALDSELLATLRALDSSRHALFGDWGLAARFRGSDVLSPRGTAVFATRALVGSPPSGVCLVGPSLGGRRGDSDVDLTFAEGRPLVYASFGSQAWYQPGRFERIIEAARAADVALFAAMGDLADDFQGRGLPPRVRLVPFAPQLQVLARAHVAISHGGANSVMEGLAAGVPLLISPICNDQPHNLHFVSAAGAGLGMDLDACSVAELAAALHQLAGDGPWRAAARRIAASYASRDGSQGAADLVEQAA
ncbi:MAG: glycosyltransferase family 1 protein [Polyangiaceae bacterium]|nr:glycosyltransferase family 1 protein [Polyangiaceae bacterium]